MVDGVTKLSKVKYRNKEERQAESPEEDDSGHVKGHKGGNNKISGPPSQHQDLAVYAQGKTIPKAMETIEIYAPIANRLGIASIKWELEDLSLKYIDPEGYEDLLKKVQEKAKKEGLHIPHNRGH